MELELQIEQRQRRDLTQMHMQREEELLRQIEELREENLALKEGRVEFIEEAGTLEQPTLELPSGSPLPSEALIAMAISEQACTYAALILHADGIPITADKIATLLKAANVPVESYWPALFAKLLEKRSVEDLITNVGSGGGGGPVSAGGAAPASGGGAATPPPVEEKKEEPKEESDEDMGFSLFD
ncbi:hypothetical protein L7F22_036389 [Adiantum nelumboides]|nr:hypothetical protein [Adiantum nelumboides]